MVSLDDSEAVGYFVPLLWVLSKEKTMIRKVCGCLMSLVGAMCLIAATSGMVMADGSTSSIATCQGESDLDKCGTHLCPSASQNCKKTTTEDNGDVCRCN